MSALGVTERPTSPVTERARAFVAGNLEAAADLGRRLAIEVADPDSFVDVLRAGLAALVDPEYRDGIQRVAPGLGPVLGVRQPLLAAVWRSFRGHTRRQSPTTLLFVADRLFRERPLEARWFAFWLLERLLPSDPERTWQLIRRGSREAGDWVTVDSLAHAVARGILAEPYRWAELEQLVYSPSRWERRLVGSTIATIPFVDRRAGRRSDVAGHGLALVSELIGDREPDVQKALSWALRSLVAIDPVAVADFADEQSAIAASEDDGHRAWVVRDMLGKLEPALAAELRERLGGIRRRPRAPSTSRAALTVARFGRLPDPAALPEPPLVSDGAAASDRRAEA